MLRKIYGTTRDEVTGECKIIHNYKFHDLYSSPNIIRVIKSRGMGLAGHVASMVDKKGAHRVLKVRPEKKK